MEGNSLQYSLDNQEQFEDVLIENTDYRSGKRNKNILKYLFMAIEVFFSLIITLIIFKFSDEVSTYFAYVIMFIIIAMVSLSTSLCAENRQLCTFSKHLGILSSLTSIFAIIAFIIWLQ